jgi:RNA polymerase sigma factor (sigma-70 family)
MIKKDSIVFVIDDDPSIQTALSRLLESVSQPCMTFGSARDFLNSSRPNVPGCIILDVRMPGMSGLDLQREMKANGLRLPIIFLTSHGDIPMAVRALKAGAVEFLTKPFHDQELLDAIRQAIDLDQTDRKQQAEEERLRRCFESLTQRERAVMELVVNGLLNKQIAARLGTSERTIKVHRARVMQKMEVESLADLVLIAKMLGISSLKY